MQLDKMRREPVRFFERPIYFSVCAGKGFLVDWVAVGRTAFEALKRQVYFQRSQPDFMPGCPKNRAVGEFKRYASNLRFVAMKKSIVVNGVAVGEVEATGDLMLDAKIAHEYLGKKGLLKQRSPAGEIFSTAQAFANTSAHLYENGLRNQPRKGASIVPFVVNSAFAIELYFKALGKKHQVTLKGHELLKLYEGLPKAAIAEIEEVIPRCAKDRGLGDSPNFIEYLKDLITPLSTGAIFLKSHSRGLFISSQLSLLCRCCMKPFALQQHRSPRRAQ